MQENLAVKQSLVLKDDFYSLAFYGFFLDTDQEELSEYSSQIKEIIET